MMSRIFLLLLLLTLSTYGQFVTWNTDQKAWCTDWSRRENLASQLVEPCNNLRYDFRVNINTGTQMVRGCCVDQVLGINTNRICSGWKSTNIASALKIDVNGCVDSNLAIESQNNEARLCC